MHNLQFKFTAVAGELQIMLYTENVSVSVPGPVSIPVPVLVIYGPGPDQFGPNDWSRSWPCFFVPGPVAWVLNIQIVMKSFPAGILKLLQTKSPYLI